MSNKILLIIAILFFASFTIGFCVGCGVENSLQEKLSELIYTNATDFS